MAPPRWGRPCAHFALAVDDVHGHSHYHSNAHDAAGLAPLDVGGGVSTGTASRLRWTRLRNRRRGSSNFSHKRLTWLLEDAAHAQGLDQIVHRAGGHAVHLGVLDHGRWRPFRGSPRLQELGEVAALRRLRGCYGISEYSGANWWRCRRKASSSRKKARNGLAHTGKPSGPKPDSMAMLRAAVIRCWRQGAGFV
jgi:hypothetical protein